MLKSKCVGREKQKIAVIMDSYYPDSRATTYIMQRILESMTSRYDVFVFTLDLMGRADDGVHEHNGVIIKHVVKKKYPKSFLRYFSAVKARMVQAAYIRKYGTSYKYYELSYYSAQIRRFIDENSIDKIVSVSSPTDVHICAEMVVDKGKKLDWIPVCFDPHAYNMSYNEKMRASFVEEEKILYKKAKTVFMLQQAVNDYESNDLKEKITFFDLPLKSDDVASSVEKYQKDALSEKDPVVITYIGNLYKNIRNPDKMFKAFLAIFDTDFRLMVVGTFSGWGEGLDGYREDLKNKFGDRLVLSDRLSREKVDEYIKSADFLVNLGNTTHNQCPSKVLDYISTGKPIIHFKQIKNCSSMMYLKKYPLVCTIGENDDVTVAARKIEEFITAKRGETVAPDLIADAYKYNTVASIAKAISESIDG